MVKADKQELAALYELLEDAAGPLPEVTRRKMFGCEALFALGNIFALIWAEGRIGVRLTDPAAFAEAMARPGAKQWSVNDGESFMKHWVLLPEADHDDPGAIALWAGRAHSMAISLGPKPEKPKKA